MHRCVRLIVVALILTAISGVGDRSLAALAQTPPPQGAWVELPNQVPAAVAQATKLTRTGGPSSPAPAASTQQEPLTLTFTLNRSNEAGFQAYLASVSGPGPHSYLSQDQLAAQFGPSQQAYNALLSHLQSHGFTLVEGSSNHLTLTVQASRGDAEQTLDTQIDDYQWSGRQFRSNSSNPSIDSSVAPYVRAVAGLSNLAQPQPAVATTPAGSSSPLVRPGGGPGGSPMELASAYDAGPLNANGSGQQIGLVEFDNFSTSDVSNWLTYEQLPSSLMNQLHSTAVSGGTSASNGEGTTEVLLDIDTALGIAPGANITVYDAPNSTSFQTMFNSMITGGATVISTSWFFCESQDSAADVRSIDSVIAQAQASGIGLFAASGDSGAASCTANASMGAGNASVPADSPHATAVGGTSLQVSDGSATPSYQSETYWNDSASSAGGYGTSGSSYFAAPSWQSGLAGSTRSIPDVSADGDPATGIRLCQGSCPTGSLYGGTSMSAPEWAAGMALINQKLGYLVGNLNQTLYSKKSSNGFHSASSMSSTFAQNGIGSFDLANLYTALGGTAVAPNALPPTNVSAQAGDGNATVSWTTSPSGGITGYTVTTYVNGNAQATKTPAAAGATSVQVAPLPNCTNYTFTVHATNGSGNSPESGMSAAVMPSTVPAAPTNPSAAPGNQPGTVNVSWTAPGGACGITGYTVTPYVGTTAQTPQTFSSTATTDTLTNLTPGTQYTFAIFALSGAGNGPAVQTTTPVTPPSAPPPSMTVWLYTPSSNGGQPWPVVTLVGGAPCANTSLPVGQFVNLTLACGSVGQAVTFTANAASAGITVLSTGASCLAMTANASVYVELFPGQASNSSCSTGPSAPGAPTISNAVAGDTQATLTWTAPASNGSTITGYTVTPYIGSTAQTPQAFNSAATTETATGLTDGTAYTFTVFATNGQGNGPASAHSTAVTPGVIPGQPSITNATPGNQQVTLTWTAPSSGSNPITSYTVTPSINGTAQAAQTFNSTATTETAANLTNGTAYTFTVYATNLVGKGAASAASAAVTPATVPGAPTNVNATGGNAQATVTWTAPASNGGSAITSYTVISTPAGGAPSINGTSATVTSLANGTPYTFTVTAVNSQGPGQGATSNSVTPVAPTPPGPPANVSATGGNAQATVTWNAPASNGGSAITGYSVTSNPSGGAAAINGTSATVTGLTNGIPYTFTVAAVNAQGPGQGAASNSVTPSAAPPPSMTVSLLAFSSNGGQAWPVVALVGGVPCANLSLTAYQWTNATLSCGTVGQAVTFTANGSSAGISVLSTGATCLAMTANASVYVELFPGQASNSSCASGPPPPPTPPGPPANVSAVGGNGQATVSWSAPASNGGSPITGYTVTAFAQPSNAAVLPVTPASASPVTVTGLQNGTPYTFSVVATNAQGPGQSATSNQVTPATAPPARMTVSLYVPTSNNGQPWAVAASLDGVPCANTSLPAGQFVSLTLNCGPAGQAVTFTANGATAGLLNLSTNQSCLAVTANGTAYVEVFPGQASNSTCATAQAAPSDTLSIADGTPAVAFDVPGRSGSSIRMAAQ